MKTRFRLDEEDLKEAIRRYVKDVKGVSVKDVRLQYQQADSRDVREHSYFYAEVSE